MKVVIASTTEATGGAARAAQRLHRGLLGNGVESTMLVGKKQSGDYSVIEPAGMTPRIVMRLASRVERIVSRKLLSNNPRAFMGLNRFALRSDRVLRELNPDIVHLHWIGEGLFSVESIARIEQPVVWTLHDMWAFTGGCYYDAGCGRYREECGKCPQLNSAKERDLTRWVWSRKKRKWPLGGFVIVTPSRWLAERAKESSLLSGCRIEVIPNGLDLGSFKPLNKQFARECLGLPASKPLILFGGRSSTDDPRKGFEYLRRALLELSGAGLLADAEALVFGGSAPKTPVDSGLPPRYLGELHDEQSLALVYSAADVFVAPSVQENLPNTVMEAMACGTPCAAFRIGGMPDLIDHGVNGHLAVPFDIKDLARGIQSILGNMDLRGQYGRSAREKVEKEYELSSVARRYTALYESVLRG